MRKFIFLILFFCWGIASLTATEHSRTDSIKVHFDKLSTLLKNDNYAAKAEFLNNFYSPAYSGGLKSYSNQLQLDSIVVNEWSEELQRIEKLLLYTIRFEDEGKTVLVDIQKWDTENKLWIKGNHNYYWFDENDRLEKTEFQEYVSQEYRLYTKIEYEYENGLIKYESKYDRIDELEEWDELEQLEYIYHDDNLLKRANINEWDILVHDWVPCSYRLFSYDSLRVLKKVDGFDYDYYENLSDKKFELVYEFDSVGNLLETVELIPGWSGEFVPERKHLNSYNAALELESETFYNWSYDADDWIGESRWVYNKETTGAILQQLNTLVWNTENNKWTESVQSDYISDNVSDVSSVKYWDFLEIYMPVYAFDDVICDRVDSYNYIDNNWHSHGFTRYHFSDGGIVGVDDLSQMQIKVFPNPVIDLLNIEIVNFDNIDCIIRNLNGQIVLQKNFKNKEQFQLSGLSSGFYYVELYAQKQRIHICKVMKR